MPSDHEIRIIAYDKRYAVETVEMWRASMEGALGIQDKHPLEAQLAYLENVVVPENKVYLALDPKADRVVGMMAVNGSELNQLYVHVAYQNAGLGSRLLALAKESAPGKLQLYTFEINEKARCFYEKHGFAIIDRGLEPDWNLADLRYEWVAETENSHKPDEYPY